MTFTLSCHIFSNSQWQTSAGQGKQCIRNNFIVHSQADKCLGAGSKQSVKDNSQNIVHVHWKDRNKAELVVYNYWESTVSPTESQINKDLYDKHFCISPVRRRTDCVLAVGGRWAARVRAAGRTKQLNSLKMYGDSLESATRMHFKVTDINMYCTHTVNFVITLCRWYKNLVPE